jgi:metal-dependent amidase/aminoacylase/carboxypeptidase family protein
VPQQLTDHTARAAGCTARVEVTEREPAVVNDAALAQTVRALLPQAGPELAAEMPSCGSDDFGYFAAAVPSRVLSSVSAGHRGPGRPLHHAPIG